MPKSTPRGPSRKVLAAVEPKIGLPKGKEDKPPKEDKTKLSAFLQAKGVGKIRADNLAKVNDDTATGAAIAAGLIAWCRTLPKG